MKLSSLVSTVSIVAILFFASNSQAAPITYELFGVASGKIGATTFTDAQVTLLGIGDTANVVSITDPSISFPIFANPFSTFTVSIEGVGTADITEDLSGIWSIPDLVPGFNPVPLIVMGRSDHPNDMESFTGIGGTGNAALAGYDLTTAIGPVSGIGGIGFDPGCGTLGFDSCIKTSLGFLSFTSNVELDGGPGTFVATLQPTSVPEPGTLLLLGSGVAALVGRSRLRTRRSGEK